jgi:hypothetical protein
MDGCVERPYSPGRGTITTRAAADEPPCICMLAPCRPACPSTEGRTSRAVFFHSATRAHTYAHPLCPRTQNAIIWRGASKMLCRSAADRPGLLVSCASICVPVSEMPSRPAFFALDSSKMGLSSQSPNLDSPTRACNSQIALCIQETHPSTQSDTPRGLVPSLRRSPSLWSLWRPGAARCPDPTVRCLVPSLSGQYAAPYVLSPGVAVALCAVGWTLLLLPLAVSLGVGIPPICAPLSGRWSWRWVPFAAGWLPCLGILTYHLS